MHLGFLVPCSARCVVQVCYASVLFANNKNKHATLYAINNIIIYGACTMQQFRLRFRLTSLVLHMLSWLALNWICRSDEILAFHNQPQAAGNDVVLSSFLPSAIHMLPSVSERSTPKPACTSMAGNSCQ